MNRRNLFSLFGLGAAASVIPVTVATAAPQLHSDILKIGWQVVCIKKSKWIAVDLEEAKDDILPEFMGIYTVREIRLAYDYKFYIMLDEIKNSRRNDYEPDFCTSAFRRVSDGIIVARKPHA